MFIYRITNAANKKVYIGQTVQPPSKRWRQHINESKRNSPAVIHQAIRKYGIESFTFEVIDTASTIDELDNLERSYIKSHNCCVLDGRELGYNVDRGGKGKKTTTRQKLSAAHTGKRFSPEHKENLKRAWISRPKVTPATRTKMSESHIGKTTKMIVIDGVTYNSVTDAATHYGVSRNSIHNWRKAGKATFVISQVQG